MQCSSHAIPVIFLLNAVNNLRKPVPIKKSKKFISDYAQSNRKYKLVAEDERKFAYYYYHEFKDVRKG